MDQSAAPPMGDSAQSYHVKTEHFEGPLDLLLTLVEKRKLFINDVALARVADDYIAYLRTFEMYPIADVANFILVASTLVLIKSKSLLPQLLLTSEEAEDIGDLKLRLRMYELFRQRAGDIKGLFGKIAIFERSARTDMPTVYAFDPRLSVDVLRSALDDAIAALPKKKAVPTATIKKVVSLEDMIMRLTTRVTKLLKTGFGHFSGYRRGQPIERERRVEVVVAFLAMLELVKQGIIHVTQHEEFGEIDIETHSFGTPDYAASEGS